jgi:formate hydrogenlyase subunit 3/multisubunit Na+/H+ antiporter MnhD subunit
MQMTKKQKNAERNWAVVIVGSIYMLLGLALVVVAALNIHVFGWGSLLLGLAGATPITASIIAIVENDPNWILLDLIIPG